ncbi:hypothetical protein HC766_02410 [Candidatus Gracilibacteria bacterium]|nr:hypothetical protein [Candidatus Gracilibacteria bacterium]
MNISFSLTKLWLKKKSTTKKKVTEIKKINSSNPKSSSKKPAQSAPKKLKQSSVISLIILFALILVGVVGYLNYKNSVDAVFDYYSTNDQRRSETIYQDFDSEQPKQKTVITRFGLNHLTYSLVHQSTDNNNEIFVETFYLKRSNPIKFEVTKSFRNIVTNKEFDEVVKLARKHDLHLDNPDENQTEIISIRDLDLTPAQQEQATQQQAAQEEQKKLKKSMKLCLQIKKF